MLAVSIKDSPFVSEEFEAEKFTISAESLFWASSKESFVLVLFSKNKFAMVISLRVGTFLICIFISLWPIIPTGNFFGNWMNGIFYFPLGFLMYEHYKAYQNNENIISNQ